MSSDILDTHAFGTQKQQGNTRRPKASTKRPSKRPTQLNGGGNKPGPMSKGGLNLADKIITDDYDSKNSGIAAAGR